MRSLALVLFLFVALSLQQDDTPPEYRSMVTWKVDNKGLTFVSNARFEDSDENSIKDRFAYDLAFNQGGSWFRVNWVYDRQQTGDDGFKTRYEVKYNMDYLVEFNSTDYKDGVFPGLPSKGSCGCLAQAPVPSSWKLVDQSEEDSELNYATWEGKLSDTAALNVTVYASEKDMVFNNSGVLVDITPNVVKMDIGIVNWEWASEDEGQLALGLNVQSKSKVRNEGESTVVSRLELQEDGQTEGASFGWANMVFMGRNETSSWDEDETMFANVSVSTLPSDGKSSIGQWYPLAFTFEVPFEDREGSVSFLWDPQVEVLYGMQPSDSDAPVGLIVGLVVAGVVVVLVVGVALVYRAKKQEGEDYQAV